MGLVGEPSDDSPGSPELSPTNEPSRFRQPTGDNDIWLIELGRNLARRVTEAAGRRPPNLGSRRPAGDIQFGAPWLVSAAATMSGGPPELLLASHEIGMALAWTEIAGSSSCAGKTKTRPFSSPYRRPAQASRYPWHSRRPTRRKDSFRPTGDRWHSCPTTADALRFTCSRSLMGAPEPRSPRQGAPRFAGRVTVRRFSISRLTAG